MESQKYAIVDLETTGHSPTNGDRMIQIAIVIMNDWIVENTFTTFIHPGKSIPLYIQDLTNITDDDVKDALPFEAHAHKIYELLEDATFVAHNADFDLSFLQAEFVRAGLPKWRGKVIDTVELAKVVFPMSLSFKLGDLAFDLNIPLQQAHRADDDAYACAMILNKCWEELLTFPQLTLEQLHKHSFRLKSNLSQLFFNALQVKRASQNEQDHFVYFNGIALRKRESANEATVNAEQITYPLSTNEKVAIFKNALPNYDERPEQFNMMDLIFDHLNSKQEVVIEASTGIGKTLGYLLPAIIYAKQNNSKVCISTYTSHLLEQLLTNEIPKIEKMIGTKIRTVLLKGMHHYIDIERFTQITQMKSLSYDETLTMLQVLVWLTKTESGDMEELNVSGGGKLFLEKIRKSPDSNNKQDLSLDYYRLALKESETADLIITNHSMLIADLNRKEPIFQNVRGFIIDEAHQFIQAAEIRDESILSYTNWKYSFGQIGLSTDDQLFSIMKGMALKYKNVPPKLFNQLETVFIQMIELFDQLMNKIVQRFHSLPKNRFETKQIGFISELALEGDSMAQELPKKIQQWVDLAEEVVSKIDNDLEQMPVQYVTIVEQWKYWIREYKIKAYEIDEIFLSENDQYSTWVEMDRRNMLGSIRIYKKPIDVKDTVSRLFQDVRNNCSIVWTSGTMTVPNNKRYIADQLGIGATTQIHTFIAKENYYNGARAYVVTDMPDIQGVSQNEYVESVALAVTRTVRATDGRCFVLFTSLDMLKKTVELIQESELLHEYMLFAQGITPGSRMRLLKSFQKFNRSVLFGTNSFWEGVDVPGDSLSAVVIVRLPFTAPEEPTFKVKCMKLQQQGRNAFTELSLPDAIIRFKQGFGRLIRTSTDKGVFIVLDRRIETKSYGKEFIQALPPISIQKLPLQDMVLELEHWYNN